MGSASTDAACSGHFPHHSSPLTPLTVRSNDGQCDNQDGSDILHSGWTNAKDILITGGGKMQTIKVIEALRA